MITASVRREVMREPCCHICGGGVLELERETWVVDHVTPLRWGGTDHRENLAKAHSTCNRWKADKPLDALLRAKIHRMRRVELFIQS